MAQMKMTDQVRTVLWDTQDNYLDDMYGDLINCNIIALDADHADSTIIELDGKRYSIETLAGIVADAKRFKESVQVFNKQTVFSIKYMLDGEEMNADIEAATVNIAMSAFYAKYSSDNVVSVLNKSTAELENF